MATYEAKARSERLLPLFDRQFLEHAREYEGIFNAHAHLDRAHTLEDVNLSHIGTTPLEASSLPLDVKQNLVGNLHTGVAYTEENLRRRMSRVLEAQIAFGVTRIDTNIDATPDLPEDGLMVMRIALELKRKFRQRLDLRVAPTPIFGFKDDTEDQRPRFDVFKDAAAMADYLSLLPEKDEGEVFGFKRHVHRGLVLARELGKEVQFHLDQMNVPGERGTERMLEVLEGFEQPKMPGGEPWVWVIHMISPAAYDEERFARLVDRLFKNHVGVIICPSAALSMRQLRSVGAPTHNSIARILELVKRKVPMRLGTDNIADVFVPSGDGDMLTEVKLASNAVRLYQPSLWAKLACGITPNNVDIASVGRVLHEDRKAYLKANPDWLSLFD